MPNTQLNTRMDADLKAEGEAILKQLGLQSGDFIRMAYSQLVLRQGLPFEVRIPNAETKAALAEPREDGHKFASVSEAMKFIDSLPDDED